MGAAPSRITLGALISMMMLFVSPNGCRRDEQTVSGSGLETPVKQVISAAGCFTLTLPDGFRQVAAPVKTKSSLEHLFYVRGDHEVEVLVYPGGDDALPLEVFSTLSMFKLVDERPITVSGVTGTLQLSTGTSKGKAFVIGQAIVVKNARRFFIYTSWFGGADFKQLPEVQDAVLGSFKILDEGSCDVAPLPYFSSRLDLSGWSSRSCSLY